MASDRLGNSKRVIVLLDTNTIMYMAEGLIPPSLMDRAIEASYRLITLRQVLEELKVIRARGGKAGRLASRALELVGVMDIVVIDYEHKGGVDNALEAAAVELKKAGYRVIVATSDRLLRKRLRRHGIPTLYYRESRGAPELDWNPL